MCFPSVCPFDVMTKEGREQKSVLGTLFFCCFEFWIKRQELCAEIKGEKSYNIKNERFGGIVCIHMTS